MGADSGAGADGAGSARSQTLRIDLSTAPHPVLRARETTRAALADWLIRGFAGEDTVLVVCEMVANAVLHTDGPVEFSLTDLGPAGVRVEVTDTSRTTPALRSSSPGRPGGHGLVIVQQLSTRWGTEQNAHGKTVWAEISRAMAPVRRI